MPRVRVTRANEPVTTEALAIKARGLVHVGLSCRRKGVERGNFLAGRLTATPLTHPISPRGETRQRLDRSATGEMKNSGHPISCCFAGITGDRSKRRLTDSVRVRGLVLNAAVTAC